LPWQEPVVADLDYFGREVGLNTPQAAADRWVLRHRDDATQDVVVTGASARRGATALLVRQDGTAHTKLRLETGENGWFVGSYQACAGHNPMR
jgi:hypothetical protein